jgi:hypothetical protein
MTAGFLAMVGVVVAVVVFRLVDSYFNDKRGS